MLLYANYALVQLRKVTFTFAYKRVGQSFSLCHRDCQFVKNCYGASPTGVKNDESSHLHFVVEAECAVGNTHPSGAIVWYAGHHNILCIYILILQSTDCGHAANGDWCAVCQWVGCSMARRTMLLSTFGDSACSPAMLMATSVQGAGLEGVVHDVITHRAQSNVAADPWEVHIDPLQLGVTAPHCPLCPPSMCKGMFVDVLRSQHSGIIFCCDGSNDLCAVLHLAMGDVALVRENYACHQLLKKRACAGLQQPVCKVLYWKDHVELQVLVQEHLCV
jgi:hypothetical protein